MYFLRDQKWGECVNAKYVPRVKTFFLTTEGEVSRLCNLDSSCISITALGSVLEGPRGLARWDELIDFDPRLGGWYASLLLWVHQDPKWVRRGLGGR